MHRLVPGPANHPKSADAERENTQEAGHGSQRRLPCERRGTIEPNHFDPREPLSRSAPQSDTQKREVRDDREKGDGKRIPSAQRVQPCGQRGKHERVDATGAEATAEQRLSLHGPFARIEAYRGVDPWQLDEGFHDFGEGIDVSRPAGKGVRPVPTQRLRQDSVFLREVENSLAHRVRDTELVAHVVIGIGEIRDDHVAIAQASHHLLQNHPRRIVLGDAHRPQPCAHGSRCDAVITRIASVVERDEDGAERRLHRKSTQSVLPHDEGSRKDVVVSAVARAS